MHALRACCLLQRGCNSGRLSQKLKTGAFVAMTPTGKLTASLICYSRRAVSKTAVMKKDDDLVAEQMFTTSVAKEDAISQTETELIKSNHNQLALMTLKDLKEIARKVGVSTSGTKKSLISKLEAHLDEEEADPELSVKRKGGASTVEDNMGNSEIISEVRAKKRSKMQTLKRVIVESDLTSNVAMQMTSVEENAVVKSVDEVDNAEPWTIFAHKKPQAGWVVYNPKTMRPSLCGEDTKAVKLISWNVNGLRALIKSGFSALQLVQRENFDVLCLQETKMQEKDVGDIRSMFVGGYDNSFWSCSTSKLGYSGTAIVSRLKPVSIKYGLGVPDHDSEGRVVTVEFDNFFLVTAYVPNSGDGLRRLMYRIKEWDPSLANHLKELEKYKPVILTGDLNCAHQEMDIHDPAGNRRSAGFTVEERESFATNFLSNGFVDTFRQQHPNAVGYTYWGYRHNGRKKNKGWRLDYFLVSEAISDKVHDSYILPDVMGSDHCPIGLILKQ